jgi:hypothetical protein
MLTKWREQELKMTIHWGSGGGLRDLRGEHLPIRRDSLVMVIEGSDAPTVRGGGGRGHFATRVAFVRYVSFCDTYAF